MGRLGEHRGRRRQQLDDRLKKYKIRVHGVVCVMVHRRAQRVKIFGRGDTLDTRVSPGGDTPPAPVFR